MDLIPAELWAVIKDIGAGAIGTIALYLFYKMFGIFVDQWSKSTEAINRNTDTHKEMKEMLVKTHEKEVEFQEEAIHLLKDTNKKVIFIHNKFLKEDA